MSHRITILCDNSVGPLAGTLGEHGFAALVETAGESLLFDTGQGGTLLHNAQRMNKNLHSVKMVALSHGHYDHTGGLWPLLQNTGGKEIYAHPRIFARRYRVRDDQEHTAIGLPYGEDFLRGVGARFHLSADFRPLGNGMFLTGAVPRETGFEKGDSGLFCDHDGCTPDTIPDDQSLCIVTPRGLVVLLGCCHAGLVNTLVLARERTEVKEIYAVIGGTHLGFSPPAQLDETVRHLRNFKIRKILGSHCTGFAASARLMREFPGQFHPAHVGYTLEI